MTSATGLGGLVPEASVREIIVPGGINRNIQYVLDHICQVPCQKEKSLQKLQNLLHRGSIKYQQRQVYLSSPAVHTVRTVLPSVKLHRTKDDILLSSLAARSAAPPQPFTQAPYFN